MLSAYALNLGSLLALLPKICCSYPLRFSAFRFLKSNAFVLTLCCASTDFVFFVFWSDYFVYLSLRLECESADILSPSSTLRLIVMEMDVASSVSVVLL